MHTSNLKTVRVRLGMTQKEIGAAIGRTKSLISQYENGLVDLPPSAAGKIIDLARDRGVDITFNDLYVIAEEGGAV